MCYEGERLSPYSPCQSLEHVLGNFTLTAVNHIRSCIVNVFFVVELSELNTAISKVRGSVPQAQHLLRMATVGRLFSSLRGPRETDLTSSTLYAF